VRVATPEAFVLTAAGLAGVVDPPPAVSVNVTETPETGLPPASVTRTEGGALTAVPTVADCETAELAAIVVAVPVVPEAVKVTGLPERPVAAAVSVLLLVPAVGPRVQLVSVATPEALVLTTAGLAGTVLPPPAVTVNVTETPETGLPPASVTRTEGGALTAVPTVADCETAELAAIVVAVPVVPEAVKVTGLPERPVAAAVTVLLLVPAVGPRVQLVRVATPEAFVLTAAGLAGVVDPPPAVRVKVTETPETGLPPASVIRTEGGALTAVPTVALWETAELAAIVVAVPVVPEAVKVTGLPERPVAAAVTVLLLVPAAGPRVQLVSVATPEAFVLTVAGLAGVVDPPPAVRVNVTATPETGLPPASVTRIEGGALTAVPTVAL
jgi:hypothetical protein